MTDITALAQREKFEAWAEEAGALPWGRLKKQRNTSGGYSLQVYTYMWTAWQAASAEMVEALEAEQQKSAKQGRHACELFDEVKQLQEQLRTVELSNSVLESRTVTVKRVGADQMHLVCLEATRHLDKYAAMAREVNKLLGSAVTNTTAAQPVTVKLPLAVSVGGQGYREQVVDILAAAGIQVIEGEG